MTTDLEARLRDTLHAKSLEITEDDLGRRALDEPVAVPLSAVGPTARRTRFAPPRMAVRVAAVAAAVSVAIGAASLTGDTGTPDGRRRVRSHPSAAPPAGAQAPASRAWPLTNDQPLAASPARDALTTPESAAAAYLAEVAGLQDWPLARVAGQDATTVQYVLQDVPSSVQMRRSPDGLWFVTGATTELVASGMPVVTDGGVDMSVGAGPRTYDNGMNVRITVLAADGRTLAARTARIQPPPRGAAGEALVVQLRWAEPELAAAVRVDALDDHDDNRATPDAVVGHWSTGMAAPTPQGMPPGFDVATAPPVFNGPGSADEVVAAYLRSRFPDFPAPGLSAGRVATRVDRGVAQWSVDKAPAGSVFLRKADGAWSVVAATTADVDLSQLRVADGRLTGTVRTTNDNSLFADVLRLDGTVVPEAPRPNGYNDVKPPFGTAGGPSDRLLRLDVGLGGQPAIVRVRLVGGTMLSISEAALGAG